jgi:hypothetical protein
MFLEDLAHGIIDGVYRTAAARSDELLIAKYLDQYGSFGAAALAFELESPLDRRSCSAALERV